MSNAQMGAAQHSLDDLFSLVFGMTRPMRLQFHSFASTGAMSCRKICRRERR